jgi:hypothetical protein
MESQLLMVEVLQSTALIFLVGVSQYSSLSSFFLIPKLLKITPEDMTC